MFTMAKTYAKRKECFGLKLTVPEQPLIAKLNTAGFLFAVKARTIPAGNETWTSPVIFTTHLLKNNILKSVRLEKQNLNFVSVI